MTTQVKIKAQVTTVTQVLEWCEIDPKAIIIVEHLNHFLKTEQDRIEFLNEFESRQLWRDPKKSFKMVDLAKQIGSYHYPEKTLDELLEMDVKEALETLFREPINQGKLFRFKEHKANIRSLFAIKQQQPKIKLMGALLYV
ncbi:hypothetical protein FHR92_004158 [Fontibacillus solani]|uniref:Uncharacterized protein n=1 Tax=Fontibacillus solani TaxID=1572857 RepID=A0A7W3SX02_9BACL|nr:hypothetical protein [Fontibacillus solani]MBA9087673.1 hypothetical protein [Fontibacillus solani]